MNAGLSGFKNAPVTRGIVVACVLISLGVGAQGGVKLCTLSYQKIIQRLELWRLVTAPVVFSSMPELFFGLYLMYFFRVFERQVGSSKYLFYVLFATVVTTILELVVLCALRGIFLEGLLSHSKPRIPGDPEAHGKGSAWSLYPASLGCCSSVDSSALSNLTLSPGPFGLIFSSFVSFFYDIPISARFELLGAQFSDKTFVYFGGLQLLLWSWTRSIIPGMCGVVAGIIYRLDICGVQQMGFSHGTYGQLARKMAPFLSGVPSAMAARTRFRGTEEPVHIQKRYTPHGWNAERHLCRFTNCRSSRTSSGQTSGSGLQSNQRDKSTHLM